MEMALSGPKEMCLETVDTCPSCVTQRNAWECIAMQADGIVRVVTVRYGMRMNFGMGWIRLFNELGFGFGVGCYRC